ncbi:MAG TPA: hypothetical protein VID30_10225 [Bradyrhizobium sp.]
MNRILKSVMFALASVHFLVDAVFMTVARPLANRIDAHWMVGSLRAQIVSLRPYPTLALVAVLLIVLEPVKPAAAYLAATGHITTGMTILVVGEVLKLVLLERLFSVSRDKLISIPAFARTYGMLLQAKEWLESFEAWQAARHWKCLAQCVVRSHVQEVKASHRLERAPFQSG